MAKKRIHVGDGHQALCGESPLAIAADGFTGDAGGATCRACLWQAVTQLHAQMAVLLVKLASDEGLKGTLVGEAVETGGKRVH